MTRRVFISYSHRDESWKDRVVAHLRVLAKRSEIDVWDDRAIGAGEDWKARIQEAIDRADTAILLISADFLISPFILEEEVVRILARRRADGLRVIPVIVHPCAWTAVEWLQSIQARPKDARPLSAAPAHEAEGDLAALALEVFPRPVWLPAGLSTPALKAHGRAWFPAIVMAMVAITTAAVRTATPVQLDVVARTVSFTVAQSDNSIQLLGNSTALSRLAIEQCGVISLPPLQIGRDTESANEASVSFRCDARVPGSKVVLRRPTTQTTSVSNPSTPTQGEIVTLGRLTVAPGDAVTLALVDARAPGIRLAVSRNVAFDFTLRRGVPLEVVSEFAEVEGIDIPLEPHGVGTYLARLPDASAVRLASVQTRRGLNVVLEPAHEADVRELFGADVDVPIDSLSLFDRSDVDDRLITSTMSGELSYPGLLRKAAVPIELGDAVRLRNLTGFRLTRLSVTSRADGLDLRFDGTAGEVSIDNVDRRATVFERLLSTPQTMIAAGLLAAGIQWAWLRRYPLPQTRTARA